jgi:glycosyltransferase involved in cell wall biosynthesis
VGVRVGIDLSPLLEAPIRGVGRALAHLIVGLVRTAGPADSLVGFSLPGTIPDFEGLSRVQRVEVCGGRCREARQPRARPSAVRAEIAERAPAQCLDAFVSPWSAFPTLSVPVVVVVHELPFVRHGPIEGVRRTLAHRFWLRRDASRAAAIVVPSEATRADVLALHPAAAPRVVKIPHGFDPTHWRVAHLAARPDVQRGVVVGATNARKGLDVLLEADRRLEDLPLAWELVGAPPRSLAGEVASRRTPRGKRFHVIDPPRDEGLRQILQTSDVLVYPSRSEGFGYPPLEAMAAGCPVVATRAGSIPEVCGDAVLLVPPGDPEALAAGVRRVLTEPDTRESLVRRGLERCRAFPLEACGAAWWELLRRVSGEAAT